jgi:hypothetical protein
LSTDGTDGAALAEEVSDRASGSRLLGIVRPEEWGLLAILLACVVLCLAMGSGFSGSRVFSQYFAFFAGKVLLVFFLTRLLFGFAVRWAPAPGSRFERAKDFVFGRSHSRSELLKTDIEVCRGLVALFTTLTVYTNVKLRIPIINPFVGDPSFQRIDDAIFGKSLWPWLERTTQASESLRNFLESVYFHDYIYFVLLVLLLYLRHDRLGLRWLFQAVAYTYILGVLITLAYPTLGPCFVRREDYEWIQQSMGMLADTQRNLWRYFSYVVQAGRADMDVTGQVFMGIAAFPSLHVGHMALLSFVAWKRYRVYTPVVVLMAALTFVATMAFGWHYAVDAIGGIALAWAVCALLWRFLPQTAGEQGLRAEAQGG